MDSPKQSNKVLIGIIVAVILVAVTAAVVMLSSKKATPSTTSNTTASTTPQPSPATTATGSTNAAPATTATYKDGNYKADATYQSPGGTETIHLDVTLSGGVITATDTTSDPSSHEAAQYQSQFIDGYKSLVVGKKIDEVSLTRVAGSSLTPGGFNQALNTIKNEAKA